MRFSTYLALGLLPFLFAPAGAQDRPRDLSVEQTTAYSAGVPRPGTLKVSIGADRQDATYAVGETARLFISANEDAYVTVFSVGPSGQVHQLFPNGYQTNGRVEAGKPTEIAGGNSGARITISGPTGPELIKVVASSKPLAVIKEDQLQGRGIFRTVEGGVSTLARNLDVVSNDQSASKLVIENFTIRTIQTRAEATPGVVIVQSQPAPAAPPAQTQTATLPVVTPQPGGPVSIPGQQPFPLLLAVDRQAYKVGDRVTVAVTSLQACYLTLLDVTTSGTIRVVFPNQLAQNNAIAANQTVLVAGGASPVVLQAAGPAGTEQLVAVCSPDNAPILGHKLDLAQLFPPAGERADVTRDLSVAANRPAGAPAFATTSFTVQP